MLSKRYRTLFAMVVMLFLLVVGGVFYFLGKHNAAKENPAEMLTVYTSLPTEISSVLAASYEKNTGIGVNFINLSEKDLLTELTEVDGKADGITLILADSEVLEKAARQNLLTGYISEKSDAVPADFRDAEGYWTGVWYDPIVFSINRDYLKTVLYIPDTWQALAVFPYGRISMTDFLASDAAANLLYTLAANYGDRVTYDILRSLHPKVIQYAKYLSNPVRQVGMGEADIAISVASETLRYIGEGYPLKIIYPTDGTALKIMAVSFPKDMNEAEKEKGEKFADWLLSDEAQLALAEQEFYFLPTNPDTMAYKTFAGKNLLFFEKRPEFTDEEKYALVDRWVKYIRFSQ